MRAKMRKGHCQVLLEFVGVGKCRRLFNKGRQITATNILIAGKVDFNHPSGDVFYIIFLIGLLLIFGEAIRRNYRKNKLEIFDLQSDLQEKEHIIARRNIEREWLIGEINHRVKNNLQIISSLFSTQSAYLTGQNAKETIKSTERRLYTISLAHQSLYQSEHLLKVSLRRYVDDLLGYLKDEYEMDDTIRLEARVMELQLKIETIVPLGLIIYEAVSNAIKFAFPDKKGGKIQIGINHFNDDESLVLMISDNGVGLPPAFDPGDSNTLGTSLIVGLGRQLGGECKLVNKQGLSVMLTFANVEEKNLID